ncbi:MAG: hypothetical protein WD024_01440, partial [Bacillota bacterium]
LVVIGTPGYMWWLLATPPDRNFFLTLALLEAKKASLRTTLKVVGFYCDYWYIYPRNFAPSEVSLTADGKAWLVTHGVGSVELLDSALRNIWSCP